MNKCNRLPAPLTGTSSRMKVLPIADISSIRHHHLTEPEPFVCTSEDTKIALREAFGDEKSNRKCVYTYEDKYSFTRILANDSLIFDSHFECGNLHSAFRLQEPESGYGQTYDLYLHNDLNAIGNIQWYYFSVSNTKSFHEVTFVIRNFSKPDSMYNEGMRPLVYSVKSKAGWLRCGYDICYFPARSQSKTADDIKGDSEKRKLSTNYILCFKYTFQYAGDTCYFAYCYPYSYTDLQKYLLKVCICFYFLHSNIHLQF